MTNQPIKSPCSVKPNVKLTALTLVALATFLTLFQIYGWLFKRPQIFDLWTGNATMSFHASISLIIAAGAIGLILFHRSARAALYLGAILGALGLLTFMEGTFGIGFSLNNLVKASAQEMRLPSTTSIYTSIAFLVLSIAIIFHGLPQTLHVLAYTGLLSVAVTAIGLACVISHLLEIMPDSRQSGLGSLAFSTAIGISMLGRALVLIEIKRYPKEDYSWVPAMVGCLAFIITLVMWRALEGLEVIDDIFPALFLFGGTLMAGLASFSAYSALIARRNLSRAREKESQLLELNASLEVKVEERTKELANSNAELERFASLAAHDLKSPINSMTQFAELLNDELGSRLSNEEKQYITFILKAGERARRMIDSLLEFAKSGNSSYSFEMFDANLIAQAAEENLHFDTLAARADIAVHDLPTLYGDRVQLTQLFQNLLANAIKFRRPGEKPKISIRAKEDGDAWRFSVADNGIGINPKNSSKIFDLFSRLHTAEEFPGTGLGLAMCRRIVENHQGRIWFESELGQGTVFHFTLPKA